MRAIKRLPVLLLATVGAGWLVHWMVTSEVQKHAGILFWAFFILILFLAYRKILRWTFMDYCEWIRSVNDDRKSTIKKTKVKPLPKQ